MPKTSRIARTHYAKILYSYLKENNIILFKAKRLRKGWYEEFPLKPGEAMQACMVLRKQGKMSRDGNNWWVH